METSVEKRVKESFARQTVMATIGASITVVEPGEVTIELPFRSDLAQQHGFIHGGVVTMIVDTACGYAALTRMSASAAVLTAEYKINFLSPAEGEKLIARGRVLKPGRALTVCYGDVHAVKDGQEKLVATMLATMMTREETGLKD
ncbi:MAG: PaaI family thioesterase [Pseudomonadota bacterium]|jgi:uncharacterized protein (TIGR00369 family)|nr:PaaI family thioesterase [Syntrophaceae bacterium]MDI9556340.1 PaaI family thioesterase [Pseudomonadota bacterium]NLX30484.1 PaaI family thioesterase [Deltaproteobacteria bacterium]HNU85577.1 PaaI family thioesterase [Syntrophales bacterium]HNZ34800.1 PaaI family thioesterase [Syntrophales bacterium]